MFQVNSPFQNPHPHPPPSLSLVSYIDKVDLKHLSLEA